MASQRTIGDVMTDAFAVTTQVDDSVEQFAVLLDEEGDVAGVIGPSGAGPAFTITAETPLDLAIRSPDLLSALIDGAPGLVVVAERRPVGVVSAEVLRQEVLRQTDVANTRQLGIDHTTHGDRAGPSPKVRIRCRVCGLTNVFDRYSRAKTYRCRHDDHDFVPFWQA